MGRSPKKVQPPRLLRVSKRRIVSRNTKIVRRMLGRKFYVHAGNTYVPVGVTTSRLGSKFGEYSFTRVRTIHMKKKKKKSGKR